MLSNRWKKAISMLLVFVLLIQVTPLSIHAEEVYPSDLTCDPQTGMSDLYEYTPFDAGIAGTAYLNNYLGTLHLRRSDLSLGGERMPVTIEFYYDPANDSVCDPYGAGWSVSYDQEIYYDESEDHFAYRNANGTWLYLVYSGICTEDGDEIWVEDTQYGVGDTGFVLYRPGINEFYDYTLLELVSGDVHYYFSDCGHLILMKNGSNQIQIGHNYATHAVEYAADSVGRKYDFIYTNGKLSSIVCQDSAGNAITSNGSAVEVSYTMTNGRLTAVTYANGDAAAYSYDSTGRLAGMSNVDRCGYTFGYTENSNGIDCITAKAAMGTAAEAAGTVTYYE